MSKIIPYILANSGGYKFNIDKMGEHVYDNLAYYHKDNFPDVVVTRPGTSTDLSLLHTRGIVTVNGYVYPTEIYNNKLYIPGGTKSLTKSRQNNIGILSFNSLTKDLNKIKLTQDMITPEYPTSMYEKVIITFNKDILHPILIIAGYPVFEHPEFFYRVSSTSFALRLDRLNFIEKLYELSRFRNIFDELEIPTSVNNISMIDAEIARSDTSIIKFLTLNNSFLIEVDCQSLTTRKIYLEHSNVPGNFRTELEPKLPIMSGYGKFTEYAKRKLNDTKYTVYITDQYYNNHLFSKLPKNEINIYNDHREVGNTYRLVEAFFLEITVEE